MLVGGLAFIAVSNTYSSAEDNNRPAPAGRPEVDGTWTPIVTLKDTTDKFKGTVDIPRPADGWWVSPIHANLLADGTVLVTGWNRPVEQFCRDHQGRLIGTSFLLDVKRLDVKSPATLKITPLDEQPRDPGDVLYCSGHAPLADGRVLFMGGARYKNLGDVEYPPPFRQDEFGLNYVRLYDPRTGKIVRIDATDPGGPEPPNPITDDWKLYKKGDRWYPSNIRLPGGKILVNGGLAKWVSVLDSKKWDFQNRSFTIFDPAALDTGKNPWRVWVSHEKAPREVGIDVFDYPHGFVLPRPAMVDGLPRHVATYGGIGWDPKDDKYMPGLTFLSLDEKVPEAKRFARPKNADRPNKGMLHETTASMMADGKIVIMGGGNDGLKEGQRIDIYDPYKDSWQSVDTKTTRQKPSSTLLPDGTILIVNGEEFYQPDKNIGDRTRPTWFNPRTNTVTELAPWTGDTTMRGYHAISLLLKDGRVLIGGGRIYERSQEGAYRIGCERPELRVFSPPYLFQGDRAVIGAGAPREIAVGGKPFTLKFTGPAPRVDDGVVLMALGAFTHGFDQNQRAVPLTAAVSGPGEVTVTPPKNAWVAPEGDYNLFLVSAQGVPSVATSVRVVGQR